MILRIYQQTSTLNLSRQVVRVVRVFNRNVPSGITEDNFTQKGGLLVGSGGSLFGELPPGVPGQYLTPDPDTPLGLKYDELVVTISDPTNFLINGGFGLAQRQAPGTLTTIADNGYGPDRWRVMRSADGVQYQRNDATSESGLTSTYYGKFKKTTGTGQIAIAQIVEGANAVPLRGKTVIFQAKMKGSTSYNVRMYLVELTSAGTMDTIPTLLSTWTLSGGHPVWGSNLSLISDVDVVKSVTPDWQNFSVTATIPANSKNVLCIIWVGNTMAVNDELNVAEAGLFLGNTMLGWTPRPIQAEQALAERYYRKSYNIDVAPGTNTADGMIYVLATTTSVVRPVSDHAPGRLRSVPTPVLYSQTGTVGKISTVIGADIGTTLTIASPSQTRIRAITDSGSGFTSGTLYAMHYTADAEL